MPRKIIRVFPRKTSATPEDEDVRIATLPTIKDEADEVHVSVTFTWDIPFAEQLAKQWEAVAPTKIGGPAYKNRGDEFIHGMYVKPGYVITHRGCPNRCWFCEAWKSEGNKVREYKISEGWNLLDNNILACSLAHQQKVYEMLINQKERVRFTGGLEAARLTEWNIKWIKKVNPEYLYFAYDTEDDLEPLINASFLLRQFGIFKGHNVGCYVLIGYRRDTFEKAERRLVQTVLAGYFPQAMLYNKGYDRPKDEMLTWRRYQREWANKVIVGYKVKRIMDAYHAT